MTSTIGWILFLIATISPDPADRVMTYSQYTDCERARNEWLQGPVLRTASACIPVRGSQPGYTNDDYTAVVYYDSREGKLAQSQESKSCGHHERPSPLDGRVRHADSGIQSSLDPSLAISVQRHKRQQGRVGLVRRHPPLEHYATRAGRGQAVAICAGSVASPVIPPVDGARGRTAHGRPAGPAKRGASRAGRG